MRLSLGSAKEILANKSPADQLNYRLNRVVEKFILDGKFIGSMLRVTLAAPLGQVALPRTLRTLESARVGWSIFEIANRWYQFKPGSGVSGTSLDVILDLGDDRAVLYTPNNPFPDTTTSGINVTSPFDFPAGEGTIKFNTYGGTTVPVVTINGRDNNLTPMSLTLSVSGATGANPFAYIDEIRKDQSDAPVSLDYIAADNTTITPMARMEEKEESASYRCYYIPLLRHQPTAAIDGFCKRRHIEFTNDDDLLPITNITALSMGLDGWQAYEENDQALSDSLFRRGVDILNAELKDNSSPQEIPRLQFIYPGRTKPRLSSHY